MKRSTLIMLQIAFVLTDIAAFISDAAKHVVVHLCRPVFREVTSKSTERPDAVMVVKSYYDSPRRVPIRMENRWVARKLKSTATAHAALFSLTDEALRAGYQPTMFVINGDEYEVECTAPDGEWAGRCITITEPFHF